MQVSICNRRKTELISHVKQKLECLAGLRRALLSHDAHVYVMWIFVSRKAANLVNSEPQGRGGG